MEFDYVVVGAGSAGCALAARLSEDPGVSVALIEAGPRDWNPWIHIPVGYFKTMHNPATDWCYQTAPDPGLNGRSLKWPRGRVLGGSSSINGLLYVRGQPQDYDRWRQLGNPGWGWDDVRPLFLRSEGRQDGAGDDVGHHGKDGPLKVSDPRLKRAICDAWIEAAVAAGYRRNNDYNGADQEGVGYFQLTSNGGWRCSSAAAYLRQTRNRRNLTVITGALTEAIEFAGRRATGIRVRRGNERESIAARAEVILCAGAIGSPQLLMLSGIGPGSMLQANAIPVMHDAAEVGRNLQDHLQARLVFKCTEPTLNDEARSLWRRIMMAAQFALLRTGPMTMAASLAAGFIRTRPELETPDIQFHVQPWSADSPGEGVHPFSAFTASVCQLRPESRGHIELASPDPAAHPVIHPNYLATETDCATTVAGIRVARAIAGHAPLKQKIAEEARPGPAATSDDDLLQWARNTATTIYHPVSTCRMGPQDTDCVDAELRVRGVDGLRVADASIMPDLVSGNTNAPTIMIGEKAADLIRASRRG